ncbi:DUF2917 domain-containing protein [Caldimonas sp. KR1-144]|uniref:DUF2917 domain-containing protein n=1 Tax=Caldimonas sp. KR1-144 TaxID=3400911 RepID=UPI003C0B2D1E
MECNGGPAIVAWAVSSIDGLALRVRPGDVVHCRSGRIWLTFEGHLDDVVLLDGESHRVRFDARAMISGFGPAGVEIERGVGAVSASRTVRRWQVRPSLLLRLHMR